MAPTRAITPTNGGSGIVLVLSAVTWIGPISTTFSGRIGAALIRERNDSDYDNEDACQHACFHFVPLSIVNLPGLMIYCMLQSYSSLNTVTGILNLFGFLDGHLVLYALYALYIVDEFGDQVFFGFILGLAT